ncbi:MAG: PEP-CTERM sorting domain-containing protein [Flavobacteriales bacterium]|nr:PEP-CTERM sorting domain-containing protein [Flavobacteriales bacterium]
MSYFYWSDLEYAPSTNYASAFFASDGNQNATSKGYSLYGWAVRFGDVSPTPPNVDVPEPTTLAIFGLGLLGLVVRRKSA